MEMTAYDKKEERERLGGQEIQKCMNRVPTQGIPGIPFQSHVGN